MSLSTEGVSTIHETSAVRPVGYLQFRVCHSKGKLLPSDILREMENRPVVSWACMSASECMLNVSKGLDLIPGNQKNQKNN